MRIARFPFDNRRTVDLRTPGVCAMRSFTSSRFIARECVPGAMPVAAIIGVRSLSFVSADIEICRIIAVGPYPICAIIIRVAK